MCGGRRFEIHLFSVQKQWLVFESTGYVPKARLTEKYEVPHYCRMRRTACLYKLWLHRMTVTPDRQKNDL
jgi:hypothetical protein